MRNSLRLAGSRARNRGCLSFSLSLPLLFEGSGNGGPRRDMFLGSSHPGPPEPPTQVAANLEQRDGTHRPAVGNFVPGPNSTLQREARRARIAQVRDTLCSPCRLQSAWVSALTGLDSATLVYRTRTVERRWFSRATTLSSSSARRRSFRSPCNGLRQAASSPTQCFAGVDFGWHTAWSTESFVSTVLRRRRLSLACPFADREFRQPAICRTRFSLLGQRSFGLSSVGIRTPCGRCAPRLEPRSGVSYGPPVLFSCACACLTSVQLLAPFTGIP